MGHPIEQLGVLITSHPKQQQYWEEGLGSWRGCPQYILLGYDHTDFNGIPLNKFMPPVKETFTTGTPAGSLGHFRGELCQMKQGGKILAGKGYKYIYKTAADTTCYRWRNLAGIFNVMRHTKTDIIMCGTAIMFAKLDAYNRCMELWENDLRSGGAELYFNSQIRALEIPTCPKKAPFWDRVLGRVHVQGEHAINHKTNVMRTWVDGQKWTPDYTHRDLPQERVEDLLKTNLV